jgi:hypothetical protein
VSNITKLAHFFRDEGYEWNFSDGRRVPSEEEINKTILMAMEALKDEPENTQMEVGRLIVKKRGSFVDVFVHIVELPKE